jgi:peptidoglycan hydrolase-like protein with peptidoglycan-binding domain
MNRVCRWYVVMAALLAPALIDTQGWAGLPAAAAEQSLTATPILVREIQFMLFSVGFDPGPLDGNAQQLTNRAVHLFQQRSGLPVTDLVNNAPISAALVERLRQEAARTLLKGASPPVNAASIAPANAPVRTLLRISASAASSTRRNPFSTRVSTERRRGRSAICGHGWTRRVRSPTRSAARR